MTERVYPLEVQLGLSERQPSTLPLAEILDKPGKTHYIIQRIDSLEKSLPDVVRSYLINKILLPMKQFGETSNEVSGFLDQELEKGYLEEYDVENPKILGKQVKCLKLNRENSLVMDVLLPHNSEEAEP